MTPLRGLWFRIRHRWALRQIEKRFGPVGPVPF